MSEQLTLKDTKNGKGVFAVHSFRKGDILLTFTGPEIHLSEFEDVDVEYESHCVQIGSDTYMGPSGNLDDFVNHSCDPNAGLVITPDSVTLIAIRDIREGEEVSFDYSTTMNEDAWEMDCLCGSEKCRKKIRDFKHLDDETKKKYLSLGVVPAFALES